MNIATVLTALPGLLGQGQAVANLIEEIIESFDDPADQEVIAEAIEDLEAENDAGHARYQAKLAEAAKG